MPQCEYCGKEVFLSFQCRECYGFFCEECQPPEIHNCQKLEIQKEDDKLECKIQPETNHISEVTENKDVVNKVTAEDLIENKKEAMEAHEDCRVQSETNDTPETQKPEIPNDAACSESHVEKEPKVAKETILTIFIMLLISVSLLSGVKFGYLSSPYLEEGKITDKAGSSHTSPIETPHATQTPVPTPTPGITENFIIILESYGFFAIQDFDGIRLNLKFENKNSNPLKVYILQAKTGSGVFMFNDARKLKKPLDEFNITPLGTTSREYFIPKLKLQEIEGDMLTIDMEVVSSSQLEKIQSTIEIEKGKIAETRTV